VCRNNCAFSLRSSAAASAADYATHITSYSPASRSRRRRDGPSGQRSSAPDERRPSERRRRDRRRATRRKAEVSVFRRSASTHGSSSGGAVTRARVDNNTAHSKDVEQNGRTRCSRRPSVTSRVFWVFKNIPHETKCRKIITQNEFNKQL